MSADPVTYLESVDGARDALKAVRAVRGQYAEFFAGVFSRLESGSEKVRKRQRACDRQLEELRRQGQLWRQERAALEQELEAVRNRAAELSEALNRQKRDGEEQQRQWSEELKRMRCMLQEVLYRVTERPEEPACPAPTGPTPQPAASGAQNVVDPMQDSIMAQFEILQNDAAQRHKSGKG